MLLVSEFSKQLYKAREEKYLLDIQRVNGPQFLFLDLCAAFLTELRDVTVRQALYSVDVVLCIRTCMMLLVKYKLVEKDLKIFGDEVNSNRTHCDGGNSDAIVSDNGVRCYRFATVLVIGPLPRDIYC
ncbi:hypothetical protein YC2023_073937 [Brassica napus]